MYTCRGLLFYSHKLFRASKWTVKIHWIQPVKCKDYLKKITPSQTIASNLLEREYKPRNNLSLNIQVRQLNLAIQLLISVNISRSALLVIYMNRIRVIVDGFYKPIQNRKTNWKTLILRMNRRTNWFITSIQDKKRNR